MSVKAVFRVTKDRSGYASNHAEALRGLAKAAERICERMVYEAADVDFADAEMLLGLLRALASESDVCSQLLVEMESDLQTFEGREAKAEVNAKAEAA